MRMHARRGRFRPMTQESGRQLGGCCRPLSYVFQTFFNIRHNLLAVNHRFRANG